MENTTDRISTLPDFILHHILSYLLDDDYIWLLQMSVVSKKWFALTASFPLLYFNQADHWPAVDDDDDDVVERIDVDAPNLKYFLLDLGIDHFKEKDFVTCMSLGSCKKLTTFYYRGRLPSEKFSDLLSNFPSIQNLLLHLSSPIDNLKLSHHFLKRLELQLDCSLEEIDLYAPNLLLFEYGYKPFFFPGDLYMSGIDSSLAKGCMKCYIGKDFDILWFQRLTRFLDKNRIFKVLELDINLRLIDVEELKLIQSPPYELAHVKLEPRWHIKESPVFVALVDAVLWCLRPRSLTFQGDYVSDIGDLIEYTYQKLLQQEDECQINIKFVMISSSKGEQHFSDLSSLLKALPLDEFTNKLTFIKEEVVQEAE